MKKRILLLLVLLISGAVAVLSQTNRTNEVTVEFMVACNANGELDAQEGTKVSVEVTDNAGNVTTMTYTFPKGSHARAITKYFADALRSKGFDVSGPVHNDGARNSKLTIRNVKGVRVGSSINGKLLVTFSAPPPPPTRRPDTLPPAVVTGRIPKLPVPTKPPTPATKKPHRGPTTLPPHGPGSIQILVTMGSSSGGQGGETTDDVIISISAQQGAKSIVLKKKFPKKTTATAITKYFHDELVKAGFDMLPYEEGDSQLFFRRVAKLDGSYSEQSAKATFGWGETPVVIDDKEKMINHYRVGVHYTASFATMQQLNDYYDWVNETWQGDIAHLNTLQGGGVEGVYMINRHFGLGLGYQLLMGSASGSTSVGGRYDMETTAQGGYLLARTEWAPGRFSLGLDVGGGYFGARYSESEAEAEVSGNATAPGFRADVRLGLKLSDHLGLVAGGGYQSLKFDDFGINWYSPGQPPAVLDMSGFTVRAGLEFSF